MIQITLAKTAASNVELTKLELLAAAVMSKGSAIERYKAFGINNPDIYDEITTLCDKVNITLGENLESLQNKYTAFVLVDRLFNYLENVALSNTSEITLCLILISLITEGYKEDFPSFQPDDSAWYIQIPNRIVNNLTIGSSSQLYMFSELLALNNTGFWDYDFKKHTMYSYQCYTANVISKVWLALHVRHHGNGFYHVVLQPSWYLSRVGILE